MALEFLHSGAFLWAGMATAVAVPTVLHLMLRSRPRKVPFPAVRFVKQTHQASYSRNRLKQLLLWLMRILVLAIFAAALAQPRLKSSTTAVAAADAPVAAVLAFDVSGSMSYRQNGHTLLEAGKHMALELLKQLPFGSQVAILTNGPRDPLPQFSSDPSLPESKIRQLKTSNSSAGLSTMLGRAIRLAKTAKLPNRELYIINDLTAHSWKNVTPAELQAGKNLLNFYLLSTQAKNPGNIRLLGVGSRRLMLGENTPVTLTARLQYDGPDAQEALVGVSIDGELMENWPAVLQPHRPTLVSLQLPPLPVGIHFGSIRLNRTDPLMMDNSRLFVLNVRPKPKVLIITDQPQPPNAVNDARRLKLLLAPPTLQARGENPVDVRLVDPNAALDTDLKVVRLVMLASLNTPPDQLWQKLSAFALRGGCIFVVPSPEIRLESYASPAARRLLPAVLGKLRNHDPLLGLAEANLSLPLLHPFDVENNEDLGAEARLTRGSLKELWFAKTREMKIISQSSTLLKFADGRPALLQRQVGQGRVWMLASSTNPDHSNLGSFSGAPHLAVLLHTMVRLSHQHEPAMRQCVLGEELTFSVPENMLGAKATLHGPLADSTTGKTPTSTDRLEPARTVPIDPNRRLIRVRPVQAGHYLLRARQQEKLWQRGFAANIDPAEGDLQPISEQKLRQLFSDAGMVLATAANKEQLARSLRRVRGGRELAGPLMIALLALLAAEAIFATRFYRRPVSNSAHTGRRNKPTTAR